MFYGDEFRKKEGSVPARRREISTPSSMMDDMPDPKHLAAQDVMDAHKSGNAHQMKEALSNFIDLHHYQMHQDNMAPSIEE